MATDRAYLYQLLPVRIGMARVAIRFPYPTKGSGTRLRAVSRPR